MSDTQAKILKAASELFLEGGIAKLSVRAIAKRAGLSTIGIYSHFQGKQGILDTLYIEGFELVYAAMSVDRQGRDHRDVLLDAVAGYLNVADNKEAHYRLIFGGADSEYEPSEEARQASYRTFNKLVEMSALLLKEDASYAKKQQLAFDVWAILHGYSSLKHNGVFNAENEPDWKKLALNAVSTYLDALTQN